MPVLMVLIMYMPMLVGQLVVAMFVLVALCQMEPDSDGHEKPAITSWIVTGSLRTRTAISPPKNGASEKYAPVRAVQCAEGQQRRAPG